MAENDTIMKNDSSNFKFQILKLYKQVLINCYNLKKIKQTIFFNNWLSQFSVTILNKILHFQIVLQ